MFCKLSIILFLQLFSSLLNADNITTVTSRWTAIPYCNGSARINCENVEDALADSKCSMEFSNTSCSLAHIYTGVNFYPIYWTRKNVQIRRSMKIPIDNSRINGAQRPYFYVFLHNPGYSTYAKLKFQFEE